MFFFKLDFLEGNFVPRAFREGIVMWTAWGTGLRDEIHCFLFIVACGVAFRSRPIAFFRYKTEISSGVHGVF